MDCTDCKTTLTTTFYEGVRIQVCTGCTGAFLSDEALHEIIARREVEVARAGGVESRPRDARDPRSCPACRQPMRDEYYEEVVHIDRCESCKGIWLDPHELEDIQFLAERKDG